MRADGSPTIAFWAVAKLADSQVAIKLNDLPPVLMTAEEAREFAVALNAELGETDLPKVSRRLRLA